MWGPYSLFFRAGPDAPPPHRVIEPGETVTSPEVHLGMVFGDLDASIQAMHDHLRRSVFMPQPRGRGGWIESGIGPELEITTDYVFHQIENAAGLGKRGFLHRRELVCAAAWKLGNHCRRLAGGPAAFSRRHRTVPRAMP